MKSHSGNGEAVYKQKEESGRSRLAEDESFILFCMSSLAERKKTLHEWSRGSTTAVIHTRSLFFSATHSRSRH